MLYNVCYMIIQLSSHRFFSVVDYIKYSFSGITQLDYLLLQQCLHYFFNYVYPNLCQTALRENSRTSSRALTDSLHISPCKNWTYHFRGEITKAPLNDVDICVVPIIIKERYLLFMVPWLQKEKAIHPIWHRQLSHNVHECMHLSNIRNFYS